MIPKPWLPGTGYLGIITWELKAPTLCNSIRRKAELPPPPPTLKLRQNQIINHAYNITPRARLPESSMVAVMLTPSENQRQAPLTSFPSFSREPLSSSPWCP